MSLTDTFIFIVPFWAEIPPSFGLFSCVCLCVCVFVGQYRVNDCQCLGSIAALTLSVSVAR